jgi:hypothetical protein
MIVIIKIFNDFLKRQDQNIASLCIAGTMDCIAGNFLQFKIGEKFIFEGGFDYFICLVYTFIIARFLSKVDMIIYKLQLDSSARYTRSK